MPHRILTLSSSEAMELVRLAIQHAEGKGWSVACAAVDAQGNTLAVCRMDGASPLILEFAQDKAFTAAMMKRPTAAFAERIAESKSLTLGLSTRQRLLPWGGGLPIVHEGMIVGGIGVSGAKDFEDIECAEIALHALGFAGVV